MRQSTSDIFKKMFPSLLIYLVILSVYTLITNLMGLGTEAIFTMPAPGEVAPPTFNPGGESFLAIILQLLYFIIVGLVGLGIVLSIYRIARYGTDVSFADQFYFFNRKWFKAILTHFVSSLFTLIGLALLVVPGIVFSIAMAPLGAVMGVNYLKGEYGIMKSIRDSWNMTKGFKGMIFGRIVIAGVIVCAIAIASSIAVMAAGAAGPMASIQQVVLTIVSGLIMYVALIDIIRELVERGAFERIDKREESLEEGEIV